MFLRRTNGQINALSISATQTALGIDTEAFTTLTFGTTTTWDASNKFISKRTLTLTGNTTISVINAINGQVGYLLVTATSTGTITLTGFKINSVILNLVAGDRRVLSYVYDGTNFWWSGGSFS